MSLPADPGPFPGRQERTGAKRIPRFVSAGRYQRGRKLVTTVSTSARQHVSTSARQHVSTSAMSADNLDLLSCQEIVWPVREGQSRTEERPCRNRVVHGELHRKMICHGRNAAQLGQSVGCICRICGRYRSAKSAKQSCGCGPVCTAFRTIIFSSTKHPPNTDRGLRTSKNIHRGKLINRRDHPAEPARASGCHPPYRR